ncbi:hypothetical protein GV054_08780 [Marinomonas mediterranea]|uniref:YhdP family phospholipid transporter n=1 Tax=Marinomonas mediterranea TaxID=119864 RepID=UPI00234B9E38|nr:AsmA-like C-terminal region-containing protein [Marinomonas mediterranea]WCN13093.1 hypothetical protein GV054_08780 [Marinomonas mediterranea]
MKNVSRWIVNLLWWSAVGFVVVLAAIVVSVKQLLPLADRYRPQIESNISQIIGLPVQIETFGGSLNGIDISINISKLGISTVSGEAVASVDQVALSFDTFKSLLTLSPQFRNVRVNGLSLHLKESHGKIGLVGFNSNASPDSVSDPEVVAERVIDYLSSQKQWIINDSKISLTSENFDSQILRIPTFVIREYADRTMGQAEVFVNDQITPIKLKARIKESFAGFGSGKVDVYARIPEQVVSLEWIESERFTFLDQVKVGGEAWFAYVPDSSWSLRFIPSRLVVNGSDGSSLGVQGDFYTQYRRASNDLRISVSNMVPSFTGLEVLPRTNLTFDYDLDEKRALLLFDELDAQFASAVGVKFLPESWMASKLIKGLEGQGYLKNASVRIWGDRHQHFQYISNLEDVAVVGFRGIPKVNHLNAIFSLTETNGYIQYQALNSTLQFNEVYDRSWETDALEGLVEWRTQDKRTTVVGTDLSVSRHGADIGGEFRLEVRPNDEDWMVLNISGRNIPTQDRLDYIPKRGLTSDLKEWIKVSLSNGRVLETGVVVQTTLQHADPQIRLELETEGLDIKFANDWPVARNTKAVLNIQNDSVNVDVESAKFGDLDISDLLVAVPISSGKARWINIKGSVKDDADKVLTSLRATPLNDRVLKAFDDWSLRGEVAGQFSVSVPLSGENAPIVDVDLSFKDNDIYIRDLNLEGRVIEGLLSFSSKEGLHDSHLVVDSLGGRTDIELLSDYVRDGELAIAGELKGTYKARELAQWRGLSQAVISKIDGNATYQGSFSINKSQSNQIDLDIYSSLDQLELSLPSPMDKAKGSEAFAKVDLKFHQDDVIIDVNYNDFVTAEMALSNNELVGANIGIDQSVDDMALNKGVYIQGRLHSISVPEWSDAMSDIMPGSGTDSNVDTPIQLTKPTWLKGLDVVLDQVIVNELNILNNVKIDHRTASAADTVFVNSDEMELRWSSNQHGPVFHFGFLSWNTSDKSSDTSAEQGAFLSARQVPNVTLILDEFYLNQQPLGDWNLQINRLGGGRVKVSPIVTQLDNGSVDGSLYWQETGEESSVELSLKLTGNKAEEITRKFSDVPFIKSDDYQFDIALAWQGTPFDFDRETLSGRIKFDVEDGNFNQVDQLPPFLRVLGIFNIDTLARRLTFDFSDLYAPGLPFDSFKGLLTLNNGQLKTTEPVTVSAPTAEIELNGSANLIDETLDERLTITLPISSTLPIAGFLLATPQIAGLLFITDKLIGKQISKVTSVQYSIVGPFSDPNVEPVKFKPN